MVKTVKYVVIDQDFHMVYIFEQDFSCGYKFLTKFFIKFESRTRVLFLFITNFFIEEPVNSEIKN